MTRELRHTSIGYIPAMDGLRALAVGLVLVDHSDTGLPLFANGGMLGVDIFFVLSGYLIASILLRELRKTGSIAFKAFYLKRLIRLWPALVLVVLVMFIPGYLNAPDPTNFAKSSVAALFYLTPVTDGLLKWHLGYGLTWTLGLEEYFYLLFPIALFYVTKARWPRNVKIAVLVAGSGFLLATTALARYESTDPNGIFDYFRVGGIGLGCALAIYLEGREQRISGTFLTIAGLAAIVLGMAVAGPNKLDGLSFIFADIGALALICGFISKTPGPVTALLGISPLAYLGLISYEIYLWHGPVIDIGGWAFHTPNDVTWHWAYPLAITAAIGTHFALAPLQAKLRRQVQVPVRRASRHANLERLEIVSS
jgi:peptidoglycan/LPS O-acetylase OafA/YrhL